MAFFGPIPPPSDGLSRPLADQSLATLLPDPPRSSDVGDMIDETSQLPNADLSLSQKLVKALILVLSGLQRTVTENSATAHPRRPPTPVFDTLMPNAAFSSLASVRAADAALGLPIPGPSMTSSSDSAPPNKPAPAPALSAAQYSDLLEVLASALRDASSAPWLWNADASGPFGSAGVPQDSQSVHDLFFPPGFGLSECDPLGPSLPMGPPPPPPAVSSAASAPPTISLPGSTSILPAPAGVTSAEIVVRDLPSLLFENLNDLVALLKPPPAPASMSSSPAYSPSSFAVTAPSSPRPPMMQLPPQAAKKPPITKLPSEMLSRILALARARKDATACECEHACTSSRGTTQKWALTLLLVCRSWKSAATYASYSSVRLRRRSQISGLAKLVRARPELGDIIADIDIKVAGLAAPGPSNGGGPGGHPYLGHPRHGSRRAAAFPWLSPPDKRITAATPSEADDQLVATLVDLCPALAKLELNISKPGFSYASWAYGADFLEQGLERALGMASSLRSLTLRACIDFCELEAVLTSCSTIEALRLEGGVDNLDGTDDALTEPHRCRFKLFFLNSWESSDLGEAQLCWLLQSSVGTLAHLEIATSVGMTAAGLAGGNPFPPFSGYNFAELLVDLAPTLVRLALKDALGQGPGLGQGNPSLRQPPHDGHFDYALARAVRLRELALEWTFIGPAFLDSLEGKPLEALAVLGSPNGHTSARDLATRLTVGTFAKLDRLALAHFPLHQIAIGWSARDVRALRKACQDRTLSLEFSTI